VGVDVQNNQGLQADVDFKGDVVVSPVSDGLDELVGAAIVHALFNNLGGLLTSSRVEPIESAEAFTCLIVEFVVIFAWPVALHVG